MARLIRFSDCPPVPWKNGTGTTRELWRIDDAEGQMLARVSVAEIAGSQAFSSFSGIDRVIMQLSGSPVVLQVDGGDQPLQPLTPFAFAGEAKVASVVSGRAQDLNLMCRRGHFRPSMQVIACETGHGIGPATPGGYRLVMALQPAGLSGAETLTLEPYDLIVAGDGETVRVGQAARLVVMDVQPSAGT